MPKARGQSLSVRLRQSPTRYRPLARIAAGGMAEVWTAEALFPGGEAYPVAIKRALPDTRGPVFRAMFEDEARLGMRLRHPNIVRVYDARDIGGTFIMVMELVEGDTLKGLVERGQARGVPMPLPAALHIAFGLARALDYAHTALDEHGRPLGVVHRDVSPHNLLLGRDGAVKLTDFGLADASVNATARSEELVGGKLGYLAPEVLLQRGSDHRIDLFALGVVLWEMLAGRRLFQAEDDAETVRRVARCAVPALPSLNGAVPAEVDALARALLAADPAARLGTAAEAARELAQLIDRVDPRVGAQDVALMMGLHLARKALEETKPAAPLGLSELLAHEMEAFAEAAAGGLGELGAAPLDPGEFGLGAGSRALP
jgi:serine/threonine-protein kinase